LGVKRRRRSDHYVSLIQYRQNSQRARTNDDDDSRGGIKSLNYLHTVVEDIVP